jgi:hypothetical protein
MATRNGGGEGSLDHLLYGLSAPADEQQELLQRMLNSPEAEDLVSKFRAAIRQERLASESDSVAICRAFRDSLEFLGWFSGLHVLMLEAASAAKTLSTAKQTREVQRAFEGYVENFHQAADVLEDPDVLRILDLHVRVLGKVALVFHEAAAARDRILAKIVELKLALLRDPFWRRMRKVGLGLAKLRVDIARLQDLVENSRLTPRQRVMVALTLMEVSVGLSEAGAGLQVIGKAESIKNKVRLIQAGGRP